MSDKPTSANSEGIYEPFAAADVPWQSWSEGDRFGTRFRELGEYGGGSHLGVCLEELAPGARSYPAHYHMLEEEHLYVLEGSLTVLLGEKSYPMSAGDFVCFPAGQKAGHSLLNHTDQACRYLIIGERSPNEVLIYTESQRVGVRLMGQGYRRSATMEYWEDIETSRSE